MTLLLTPSETCSGSHLASCPFILSTDPLTHSVLCFHSLSHSHTLHLQSVLFAWPNSVCFYSLSLSFLDRDDSPWFRAASPFVTQISSTKSKSARQVVVVFHSAASAAPSPQWHKHQQHTVLYAHQPTDNHQSGSHCAGRLHLSTFRSFDDHSHHWALSAAGKSD